MASTNGRSSLTWRAGGGYQRRQKERSGGSVWTYDEVTRSREWKTSELRHVGTAIASGPVVSKKLVWKRRVEVGYARSWTRQLALDA